MYKLDHFKFECEFDNLEEIDLRRELKKRYNYYPNGVVKGFIRQGIYNLKEMKTFLEMEDNRECGIRNIGPQRKAVALKLIKKYEIEAIKNE